MSLAQVPAQSPVIDVHAHFIPAGAVEAARRGVRWHGVPAAMTPDGKVQFERHGRRVTLPWADPGASIDHRLSFMTEHGIDVQVLSFSPLMYWYDIDAPQAVAIAQEVNDTLAGIVNDRPTRFQGLAHLPLQNPDAAVAELHRAVATLGLAGAAVGTHVAGTDWDAPLLQPVLEAAAELEVLVFLHPAAARFPPEGSSYHLRNVIGNPLETTVAVASMIYGGVLDRLPELTLCLAHGGGYTPAGSGRFDHARRMRAECQGAPALPSEYLARLYYDSLTHSREYLRFLIDQVGRDRVLLGTDHPADMEQADPVAWIEQADHLDPADRDAVLGGNALRLLGAWAHPFVAANASGS